MFRLKKLNSVIDVVNPKKIILVRHGESIWNQESKFTGWTNIPLTDNGRKEAKKIGLFLIKNNIVPNILFSSVLNRSIETSNIIKDTINKYITNKID